MTCPRCGEAAAPGERCPRCGVVVVTYAAALEKMRRAPAPRSPAGATRVAPVATAVQAVTATAAAPVSARAAYTLSFHGRAGTLFGIRIVNMLWTLLTLGVYYFWGKVRVRRYAFSQTACEGDRFVYHGTGGELARGFAKALVLFILPVIALNLLPRLFGADALVENAAQLLGYVVVSLFMPIAMVGAHRYRLSRTSWRGIRFSFGGRTADFIKLFLRGSTLTTLTLGLYYPVFDTQRRAFMVANARFGNRRFGFDGNGRPLVRPFLVAILLTVPTLGLAWFWYAARKRRYFWEHTTFDRARFHSTVTGRQLLKLTGGNALLLLVTLGVALPWVFVRNARFACDTLRLAGALDLAGVIQAPQTEGATGDALSSFLGVDVGIA
jgi:uncharacterized membrane protein YjgN (DUF898 family)